jgi:circadian clock protein KaiC
MADVNLVVESTGIKDLDTMLGGGLPVGSVVVLLGIPGSGKTILSQQLCYAWLHSQTAKLQSQSNAAANGPEALTKKADAPKVLFFTTFSEPQAKLLKHLSSFSFFDRANLDQNIKLLSLNALSSGGLSKVADIIIQTVLKEKAQLVVIDSLSALEAYQTDALKHFIYRLSGELNTLKATVVISLARIYQSSVVEPDLTFADGIIGLASRTIGVRRFRYAEVLKMRGMNHLLGLHAYDISSVGLTFYPRLETWLKPELEFEVSNQRLGFGLPELEQLLDGGVYRYSSTMIAGSVGTGKTLSSLYYLIEGARQGEPGLYVGFYESREQLINKSTKLGLDLQSALDSGAITVLSLSPVELVPDQIASRIQKEVVQHQVKRLVVDGFEVIEWACRLEERSQDFVSAFVTYFKLQGITSLYTYNIAKLIGSELDLSATPFALLAENLILLRQVEHKNRLYRIMAVLKMRDSDFDPTIRQFTIEKGVGIKVLQPFESADGLLSELAYSLSMNDPTTDATDISASS